MEKSKTVIASCRNKGVSSLHKSLSLFFIRNALEVLLLCPVIGWGAWTSKLWDANKGLPRDSWTAGSKPAQQDETQRLPAPIQLTQPKRERGTPQAHLSPCLLGAEDRGEITWSWPPAPPVGLFWCTIAYCLGFREKRQFLSNWKREVWFRSVWWQGT